MRFLEKWRVSKGGRSSQYASALDWLRISAKNFGAGNVESIPLYAVGCLADDIAASKDWAWG